MKRRRIRVVQMGGAAVRVEPAAADAIEARVLSALRMSGGTMPIVVVVSDDETCARAVEIKTGRKHANLVEIITEAELDERLSHPPAAAAPAA